MKKFILVINFILLGFLIFSFTFISLKKNNHIYVDEMINKEHVQAIVNKKNIEIKKLSKKIEKYIEINEDTLNNIIYEKQYTDLEKNDIGIYIYKNNILKYWTSNKYPLPTSATIHFFEKDIIYLNNGWYLCYTENINDCFIVTLFQIKKDYSYENDNLDYNYNKEFNLPKEIIFSTDYQAKSIEIATENEKFYLTLPPNISVLKKNILTRDILIIINVVFVFYLLFSFFHLFIRKQKKYKFLFFLLFIILIAIVRFLMIHYNCFYSLKDFDFFSSTIFAQSALNSSLADLLLNTLIIFSISILFYKNFKSYKIKLKNSTTIRIIMSILLSIIMLISAKLLYSVFFGLVKNSSIPFELYSFFNLNIYSFIGIIILIIILFSSTLFYFTIINIIRKYLNLYVIIICLLIGFLSGQIYNFDKLTLISFCIFNLFFFIFFSYISYIFIKQKYKYIYIIIYLVIFSLTISLNLSYLMNIKEIDKNYLLLNNLADESDILAEFFLLRIEKKLKIDSNFNKYIIEKNDLKIDSVISKKIRSIRYFNSYDFSITICNTNDSITINKDSTLNCNYFFNNLINKNAHKILNSSFYFINSSNYKNSYLSEISSLVNSKSEQKIFLELYRKTFSEGIGYPELLIDKRYIVGKDLGNYNFLHYKDNILVNNTNIFQYDYFIELLDKKQDTNQYLIDYYDGFINYKYKVNKSDLIVLSKPYNKIFNDFISFIYIFIFVFIIFHLFKIIKLVFSRQKQRFFTISNKIYLTFGLSMLLSLLILGTISLYFINQAYKQKQRDVLKSKLNSILIDLNAKLADTQEISNADSKDINNLLVNLSNIYFIDINIFDTNGTLYSSSRTEFFDRGLKGRYMNPLALKSFVEEKKGYIFFNDKIDKLNFISVYIPYRNKDNKIIAYINLPYFMLKSEFITEISNFIITFTNIFFILMIISIIISLIISRQISKPLISMQNKIQSMRLNVKNEKIIYNKNDEIGSLINAYNRKVDELSLSAEKLAKSERESAWREMAKQIAHEIKNPLTPMKLNLQFLLRTFNPDDETWKNNFIKMANNTIGQIDALSNIASEFSNFAKTPTAKKSICDLKIIIQDSINLFVNNYEDINFTVCFDKHKNYNILVDKEQIQRAFNNIIKNAIQSIPDNRQGEIIINIKDTLNNFIVEIIDNGSGILNEIESKIFSPNFTTKSSGMGLGLSIVKTIMQNNSASIYFNTTIDKGSTFFIEIPKFDNNK